MGRGSLCLSSSMRARPTLGWPKFTFHRIAMDARFSTHPFRSNLRLNFRRLAPLNVNLASTTEFQICLLARRRPTDLSRRVYDTTSHDSVSRRYSDEQFSFVPLNIENNEEQRDWMSLKFYFSFASYFQTIVESIKRQRVAPIYTDISSRVKFHLDCYSPFYV